MITKYHYAPESDALIFRIYALDIALRRCQSNMDAAFASIKKKWNTDFSISQLNRCLQLHHSFKYFESEYYKCLEKVTDQIEASKCNLLGVQKKLQHWINKENKERPVKITLTLTHEVKNHLPIIHFNFDIEGTAKDILLPALQYTCFQKNHINVRPTPASKELHED